MTINPNSQANKYELARVLLWQKLPYWKKEAIEKAEMEKNFDDHTLTAFTKELIHLAESDDFMAEVCGNQKEACKQAALNN